jgi:hypothetical protein
MKRAAQNPRTRLGRAEHQRMCTRKRRYRSQGDALDAALLAGVERHREAYFCPICQHWHLTSA